MSRDGITFVILDKCLFLNPSGLAWLVKGLRVELSNLGSLTSGIMVRAAQWVKVTLEWTLDKENLYNYWDC